MQRTEEQKERYLRGVELCYICNEEKSLDAFPRAPRNWTGYSRACKVCWQKRQTAHRRLKKTGWTQEEYDVAFEEQKGLCAICKLPDERGDLAADHCHTVGTKRGLLCRSCNQGLGSFKDDPELLLSAAQYLMEKDAS